MCSTIITTLRRHFYNYSRIAVVFLILIIHHNAVLADIPVDGTHDVIMSENVDDDDGNYCLWIEDEHSFLACDVAAYQTAQLTSLSAYQNRYIVNLKLLTNDSIIVNKEYVFPRIKLAFITCNNDKPMKYNIKLFGIDYYVDDIDHMKARVDIRIPTKPSMLNNIYMREKNDLPTWDGFVSVRDDAHARLIGDYRDNRGILILEHSRFKAKHNPGYGAVWTQEGDLLHIQGSTYRIPEDSNTLNIFGEKGLIETKHIPLGLIEVIVGHGDEIQKIKSLIKELSGYGIDIEEQP